MSGLRLELLGSMPGERNPVQLGNVFDSISKFLNQSTGTINKISTAVNTAAQFFNPGSGGGSGGGVYTSDIARQQQEAAAAAQAAQAEALAQERARQEKARQSNNTVLYVSLAAGGVALTLLGVAIVKRRKKKARGMGRVKSRKAARKKRRA
jgi:hypothetical protein